MVVEAPETASLLRDSSRPATLDELENTISRWFVTSGESHHRAPRILPEEVLAEAARVAEAGLHEHDRVVAADAIDVEDWIDCLPEGPLSAWIANDIRTLAPLVARLGGTQAVRIDLGSVHSDACRKFHVDYVPLRMVCTYAGPGTEFLEDGDVDRAALARTYDDVESANAAIAPLPDRVRHATLGELLFLRGARANSGAPGAVHRSPPIAERGLTRLLLTITAATETPTPRY